MTDLSSSERELPPHERIALAAVIQYHIIISQRAGIELTRHEIVRKAGVEGRQLANLLSKAGDGGSRRLKDAYEKVVNDKRDVFVNSPPPPHIKAAIRTLYPSYEDEALGPKTITSKDTTSSEVAPSERPEQDPIRAALENLLNLSAEHYSTATPLGGEYFGYRRSANRGEIIRMYMRVNRQQNPDLFRFENLYRRRGLNWLIKGFGLVVERNTYLIGHAVAEMDPGTTYGLRSYALLNLDHYGWFGGPLTSVDDQHKDPIAARVVLIPAEQHKSFRETELGARRDKIMEMIKESVTPQDIDKELVEHGIPSSTLVEYLIWNATFTTLHAHQRRLHAGWLKECQAILDLQKRALEFSDPVKGQWPFVQIAKHVDSIFPTPE